jgi:protoporphyrinogen oxidase
VAERRPNTNSTFKKPAPANTVICWRTPYNIENKNNSLKTVYNSNKIITDDGIIISVQKTKLMASTRPYPVRSKIVIDNKTVEEVNSVIYLGKLISY